MLKFFGDKQKHLKKIKMAMANKPKIQTMKDDLREIEEKLAGESGNKKRYNNSISKSQNEIPAKIKEPEILSTEKEKDAAAQISETENDEVVRLKNIISRVLQTAERKEPAREPDKKENIQDTEEKTEKFPVKESVSNVKSNLEKTVSAVEAIAKKPISIIKPEMDRGDVSNKEEIEKRGFWKSISENFRKRKNVKEAKEIGEEKEKSEIKEIDETKETDEIKEESEAKKTSAEDKISKTEKSDKSGTLKSLSEKMEKTSEEESRDEEAKKKFEEKEYLAPENRLTLKKQEYYSSIRKKIKQKEQEQEEDLEDLAKTVKQKQKILSKSEEYKKLKQKIIKKYHIRIFSLPWKKIMVFSSFAIAVIGVSYFFMLSYFTPPPTPPPPVITANELAMFDSIKERDEITEDAILSLGYLETVTGYLDKQKGFEISKLIVINNWQDKKMPIFRKALELIKINPANFPEEFWGIASNDYNLFIFKTKMETYRLGIAVKLNNIAKSQNIMGNWEQETNKNKRITKVFKGLFLDDPLPREESFIKPFNSTVYKNINIRYIHLPDKNTSLNYFIYNDIFVITTSKDSSFLMVDLMTGSAGS